MRTAPIHEPRDADSPPAVADGYQLKLIEPYNYPTLHIRKPGNDAEEVHQFPDDDAFFTEMSTFIDTYEGVESSLPILSSYADGRAELVDVR